MNSNFTSDLAKVTKFDMKFIHCVNKFQKYENLYGKFVQNSIVNLSKLLNQFGLFTNNDRWITISKAVLKQAEVRAIESPLAHASSVNLSQRPDGCIQYYNLVC